MREGQVKDALMKIVEHSNEPALNWAVNYARMGLGMTGEELRIQCLYAQGNITQWRGPLAKEVRETLKAFIKENDPAHSPKKEKDSKLKCLDCGITKGQFDLWRGTAQSVCFEMKNWPSHRWEGEKG